MNVQVLECQECGAERLWTMTSGSIIEYTTTCDQCGKLASMKSISNKFVPKGLLCIFNEEVEVD